MITYRPTANCQDIYSERASEAAISFNSAAVEGNLAGLLRDNTVVISEETVVPPIGGPNPAHIPLARIATRTAKRSPLG